MQNAECRRASRRFRVSFCVLRSAFCVSLLALAGCNVLGAVVSKASPPATIKAQFKPAKEPTLVLVENFSNPAALRLESDAVARHVVEELRAHGVGPVLEPSAAEELRQKLGGGYRKMALDAIGRELGAKQVIYVDLNRFDISHDVARDLPGAKAEARVRVVDDAGEVLWPLDSGGGHPIAVKVEPQRAAPGAGDNVVRRKLHAALATQVARLFYDWKSDSPDGAEERF